MQWAVVWGRLSAVRLCVVCMIFGMLFFGSAIPCGPVCTQCGCRYAREEQHDEHCCARPDGHAVLPVCTQLAISQVAVICCADAQLSGSQSVVTVRSSRRSPSDPRPVAFRAGSAPEGGVRCAWCAGTGTQECGWATPCAGLKRQKPFSLDSQIRQLSREGHLKWSPSRELISKLHVHE